MYRKEKEKWHDKKLSDTIIPVPNSYTKLLSSVSKYFMYLRVLFLLFDLIEILSIIKVV